MIHNAKNMNAKIFDLIVQLELWKCKCRLNGNLCNLKQIQNYDKYRCKFKESVDWSSCRCVDIKNFACKKPVIDNLVFTCEDEIINTTETTLKNYLDKKVITKKNHCLIRNISLVIIRLFLLVFIFYKLLLLVYKTLVKKLTRITVLSSAQMKTIIF